MRKTWITITVFVLISIVLAWSTRQALAAPAATMTLSPNSGSFESDFKVNLEIDGHGEAFNAAQATVALSSNLFVKDLILGNCNFSFLSSPDVSNPSFRGVILGSSSQECSVYTLVLASKKKGEATIKLTDTSVIGYKTPTNILSSTQNATFTLASEDPTLDQGKTKTANSSADTSDYTVILKILTPDDKPIENKEVTLTHSLNNTPMVKKTDSNGQASFEKLSPGVYIASVSNGSQEQKTIINVDGKNHTLSLSMRLQEENGQVQNVQELLAGSKPKLFILVAVIILSLGSLVILKSKRKI